VVINTLGVSSADARYVSGVSRRRRVMVVARINPMYQP
jgi:hypothetical protein